MLIQKYVQSVIPWQTNKVLFKVVLPTSPSSLAFCPSLCCLYIRIGPDRAYPLHFTHPQLLLPVLPVLILYISPTRNCCCCHCFFLPFWALSFEMITFQPLILFPFIFFLILNFSFIDIFHKMLMRSFEYFQ